MSLLLGLKKKEKTICFFEKEKKEDYFYNHINLLKIKKMKKLTLLLVTVLMTLTLSAQDNPYFIELFGGIQTSELKKTNKDNTSTAPYLHLAAGYQLHPTIALGIGYQGPHFKYSGDNIKHNYALIDAKAIINLNQLIQFAETSPFRINAEVGAGALINSHTDKTNFAFTAAITPEYRVLPLLGIKLRVGGALGKDIYESNTDILFNASLGITKYF